MKTLSFIFLILGLVSKIYAETCPPDEDIYPCSCIDDEVSGDILVTCSDSEMTLEGLKKALNGFSGKKDVDLLMDSLKLHTVPSNFFYGIDIKKLDISYCELDSLSDDGRPGLLGLENTLQELVISSSFSEKNVPAKLQLGHLNRLKEVELYNNVITEMSDDWFDRGPASLEYLTISNNGIEKVGSRVFANLINLKELLFDGNRFGGVKRSMFPNPAQRLEKIELDNNALTGIPEDFFSNLPTLREISFRTNGIFRLEQRTWQSVWEQLYVISLQGNPIRCDPHMDWMFSLRRTSAIYGTCDSPSENKGKSLQQFIDDKL